jgi:hypothetical protein
MHHMQVSACIHLNISINCRQVLRMYPPPGHDRLGSAGCRNPRRCWPTGADVTEGSLLPSAERPPPVVGLSCLPLCQSDDALSRSGARGLGCCGVRMTTQLFSMSLFMAQYAVMLDACQRSG